MARKKTPKEYLRTYIQATREVIYHMTVKRALSIQLGRQKNRKSKKRKQENQTAMEKFSVLRDYSRLNLAQENFSPSIAIFHFRPQHERFTFLDHMWMM